VAKQIQAADCVCLPSVERTEAFGLVLLEAMRFGKATIASDVPGSGMGWIVEHEVTGIKVPPESAPALAEALQMLQANRDIIGRLGEAGRRKFTQRFHIDRCAAELIDLYASLPTTG
jgi:rhamnosyl/mannosyltransferase